VTSEEKIEGGQKVFARVNFLQTTSERIADVGAVVRDVVHPGIRDETGYVGYVVLGDSESGKALGSHAVAERGR
jgi:hypothetical protein